MKSTADGNVNPSSTGSHKSSSPDRLDVATGYVDRPRSLSVQYYASSPPKLERLSGQFNAPTELEIEKYKINRIDRLKNFGRRVVRKGN
jgi:hypothetical protein